MINIVLKLSLVEEIVHFSPKALHFPLFVDLSKCVLCGAFADSHIEINWERWIINNISCIEDSIILPILQHIIELILVVKCWYDIIILRCALELIDEDLRQLGPCYWLCRCTYVSPNCIGIINSTIINLRLVKSRWDVLFVTRDQLFMC